MGRVVTTIGDSRVSDVAGSWQGAYAGDRRWLADQVAYAGSPAAGDLVRAAPEGLLVAWEYGTCHNTDPRVVVGRCRTNGRRRPRRCWVARSLRARR